jgi:HK97 family phage prohead protease
MEIKASLHHIKSIEGRTVTGIFAVHGNIDGGGDRSHPGAFAKTFQEGGRRVKFLWMHDQTLPPIAVVKSMREVGIADLPAEVMAQDGVTGGAEVVREYLTTERGDEILTGIVAGAITEMSYGYDALKFDFEQLPEGKQVRNLREVKLWDVSDVTWGMNSATVGSKFALPLETLLAQLRILAVEVKAGRRNNAEDQARIDALHVLAVELGAANCFDPATLASRAAPLGTHSPYDMNGLFLEYQRTLARLHGARMD